MADVSYFFLDFVALIPSISSLRRARVLWKILGQFGFPGSNLLACLAIFGASGIEYLLLKST